jgi:hypothetical protein
MPADRGIEIIVGWDIAIASGAALPSQATDLG